MPAKTSNVTALMRLVLTKGEVYRVPSNYRGLRVRSGQAWITLNGRDLVFKRGDEATLEAKNEFAVVSALGCIPLVIELLGETPCHSTADPHPVANAL